METFGERLRAARERANLSQRALAVESGVAQNTISRLERGLDKPQTRTVEALASGLGIPPALLLGETPIHDVPQPLVTRGLPLFGTVPAGHPSEAEPGEQLDLFPVLAHLWAEDRYVLRVEGDSMWPKYQRGDLVVVEYVPDPEPVRLSGKTCVCLHNGRVTMKVVDVQKRKDARMIVLRGANVDAPVIVVQDEDEFAIQGRVVGIVQRFD